MTYSSEFDDSECEINDEKVLPIKENPRKILNSILACQKTESFEISESEHTI